MIRYKSFPILFFCGLIIVAACHPAAGFGILHNSATGVTPEDSLGILFFNLDSLGRNIGGLDTTRVIVFNPGGDSVFAEIVAGVAGRVKLSIDNGDTAYRWVAQVSDIDGPGQIGQYLVKLNAKSDQTGGWLKTPALFYFQLVSREFDDALVMLVDSLQAVIDSLQNMDNWVGNFRYSNPDSTLTLRRLAVAGANGANGSLSIDNSTGPGLSVTSGTGDAVKADGLGDRDFSGTFYGNLTGSVGAVTESVLIDISANIPFVDTIANRVLEDSLHYRGEGSDSVSLARWVWNTPQANHTVDGTFGKYLDTEISGIGSGSGLYARSVFVVDSSVDQPVPGTRLVVRNLSQSALIALGVSDADGAAAFNLDSDSFLVLVSSPGYIFESYDTIAVAGPGSDTLYGCRFDPGTPILPDLCRVYGFIMNISGLPESNAAVTAWLPSGVSRSGGGIISPFKMTAVSDSTGYFYLDLIPSSRLTPSDTRYEFTIARSDGTILRQRLLVPAISKWILTW